MKNLFAIFTIVFIHFASATSAQNSSCNFIGTQWKIKSVVIKRTGALSIEDSLYYERWYKNHESIRLCFYGKNRVRVEWNKNKTEGKYTFVNKEEGLALKILLKGLSRYDYGSKEKLSFGNFLLELSSISKYILNDCSFVMTMDSYGLERKIFFEQVK